MEDVDELEVQYPDSALRLMVEHCEVDPRSAQILYLLSQEVSDSLSTRGRRAKAAELMRSWLDEVLPDYRRLAGRRGADGGR